MGIDIETYRGRIGTFKFASRVDVIIPQCTLNFSRCLKAVGSLVFIGILLLMAGIEQNPGPTKQDTNVDKEECKYPAQESTSDLIGSKISVSPSVTPVYTGETAPETSGTEEAELQPTSASLHDARLTETEWHMVVNEIKKWRRHKKRYFLEDFLTLIDNDYSEPMQKLKYVMNNVHFTGTEEIRDLLKDFGKQKRRGNVLLIRDVFFHYNEAQIGNHPDDIFEQIEAVSPLLVPEIIYAIIKLYQDVRHRRYIRKCRTLLAHIGAFLKPELDRIRLSPSVMPVFKEETAPEPPATEKAEIVPKSARHHDAGITETEWDKVVNEIRKLSTLEKRHFFLDVVTLFRNDHCETVQELKSKMNKVDFNWTEKLRDLLKKFGKELQDNVSVIREIRNILMHYADKAQKLDSHPDQDDIFEKMEAVSPLIVSGIMYAIIQLCKDVMHRRYINKYTSLGPHIGAFVKPELETGMEQEYIITFNEIVSKELRREIDARGYKNLSRFQTQVIQKCIKGYDVIVQAQAGTGKMTSICIAVLQKLDYSSCQAVVLANSKGRAEKIRKELEALGHNMGVKCCTCYEYKDVQKLQNRTAHVLIGINGAMKNVFTKGFIDPGSIRMMVIDEADLILSSGRTKFRLNVYNLLKLMPNNIQKIMCSGVVTQGIEDIEKFSMTGPVCVKEELTLDGIKQYKIRIEEKTLELKCKALCDKWKQFDINRGSAVIFCNSPFRSDKLAEEMSSKVLPVSVLHPNDEQNKIHAFNSGYSRVLVTTDLDLHEVDIRNVSHIINFDFPYKAKGYIRRIGMLNRFERKGIVINFTKDDEERLRYIERCCQTEIEQLKK